VGEETWRERIKIDPNIVAGKPVIAGTRVPVQILVGSLGGGMTIEEICEDYNVTEEDVRAALIYAAEVLAAKRRHALPRR
jgi:uncharacterized protein (DUF433 family)